MQEIDAWLKNLGSLPDLPNVHNLYSKWTPEGPIRVANLRRYFEQMLSYEPRVLLVGEAPGYQGTYRTGIPFGSEAIILGPVNKYGLFGGPANGFNRVLDGDRFWKEPTATVVQRALDDLDVPILAWATFPLHPHNPGVELSNRAPTRDEIALGAEVLLGLLAVVQPERVIAVGNVAASCLAQRGVPADKVRHPSHGGAMQFRAELFGLLSV
jgi:uracil-DNA glycosylase